jgi:membrane protein
MGFHRTPAAWMSKFVARWGATRCTSRAAALSFYAVFSLGPMLLMILAAGSLVLDEAMLRRLLLDGLRQLVGGDASAFVASMLDGSSRAARGRFALGAAIVLLVTATTALAELKESLDDILLGESRQRLSLRRLLRARLLSFALLLTFTFVLVFALLASAVLPGVADAVHPFAPDALSGMMEPALRIAGLFALFAAIYRLLPDMRMSWAQVLAASTVATLLFIAGRAGFGFYLAHSLSLQAFGPAVAMALLLLWIYFAALVLLAVAVGVASMTASDARYDWNAHRRLHALRSWLPS